jgi:dipeptidase D
MVMRHVLFARVIRQKGNCSMGVLDGLEPQKVFQYFEEICRIPHGSGNVEAISNHLLRFAKERGLECYQDKLKNIIIIKEATPGYEQEEPFILQGHMDMVAVKDADCRIDMEKEPLRLKVEDGKISAESTSLGGDDGIAVAYCLALLDEKELGHPRLEIVLTTDEETGMEGATGIDLSMLKGKRMINLDNEEEGVFITSCAGGARVDVKIPIHRTAVPEENCCKMQIGIHGLTGGHSGTEIIRNGGNANVLLGELLEKILEQTDAAVLAMDGGVADNAIPREATAVICVRAEQKAKIITLLEEQERTLKERYAQSDPELSVVVSANLFSGKTADQSDLRNALACLASLPNGVTAMSRYVPELVETSLNLGTMKLTDEALTLAYAVRSSVDDQKESLCHKIQQIAARFGAAADIRSSYPGWVYRVDSPLRNRMCTVYEKLYGIAPRLEAIHAGLECGILAGKIAELDCVSIGPDLYNVHTTHENMDIVSVRRTWEFITAVLSCVFPQD